jgi:acetyl-CoA synthetase
MRRERRTGFPGSRRLARKAHIDAAGYEAAVARVEADPEGYWRDLAGRLDWIKPPTRIKDVSFAKDDFRIHWYADGVLNVSANCIDRHLPHSKDDVALVFEGDEPAPPPPSPMASCTTKVCRMANVLKDLGAKKGDRITIYLPMIPLAAVAMLACARIGAVHSVVFGGFSPDSIAGRIQDCESAW